MKPDPLEPSIPAAKQDATKTVDVKPVAANARVEAGGSAPGSENLFGTGDFGVVPGAGTASSGGNTASLGLIRGSRAAGPPAHQTIF